MDKYENPTSEFLLPAYSNTNSYLKEIVDQLKIPKKLSFHLKHREFKMSLLTGSKISLPYFV
ncbi:hypothetical protein GCM10008086_27390 [Salegentibacter mishustinae]|nr:hypothetical protein GCM10008086_27390 [Salegentibacter mishustinae]